MSNPSAWHSPATNGRQHPAGVNRGRILVLEPDPLTQWSLRTYLRRWFMVDGTGSVASAQRVLETHPVDALVISEELSSAGLAYVEQCDRSLNPRVVIVRTIADPSKPRRPGTHVDCLEKPFELARLARLLGVPEGELPDGA
jgi:DNA-binding NtrC family response regulator